MKAPDRLVVPAGWRQKRMYYTLISSLFNRLKMSKASSSQALLRVVSAVVPCMEEAG